MKRTSESTSRFSRFVLARRIHTTLGIVAVTAFVIALVVVPLGTSANASWFRLTDDDCKGLYSSSYFFADGPSIYWYTNSGGANSCHMWTTTIDQSLSPENIAWYYTDPTADGTGYASLQANMVGADNSCGSVNYGLMANGDTGGTAWYYVSQAGPATPTVFSSQYVSPPSGAKIKLPDNQPCAVNSSISTDYVYWSGQ